MAGFESTNLWQTSLAKQLSSDEFEKERDIFRVSYDSFREKAAVLGSEISTNLPDYTVHDITHIDALWDMASTICGNEITLNPAEAFVLGGAFLIHDLGMGLAAYPLGIEGVKKNILWSDTFSYLKKNKCNTPEHLIEKETLEIVLRSLHAEHAEKLAFTSWNDSGKEIFLIDSVELRADYGQIIGKLAYSHWWDSNEILKEFPEKLGASGNMPKEWTVDPVKLACIMRVADASHIDSRRAPLFLKAVRNLSGYSALHWSFQQKLYQPRLDGEQLVYTSKSAFSIDESKSWWLCYEALVMIDSELRAVDSILTETQRTRFKAKSVAGVNNFSVASRLIATVGWFPIDTRVHVGNVARLVKNLGGDQLYGRDRLVPLRELIQNACDAIRARRILESEPDFGYIVVRNGIDNGRHYIEVEDNGVGMSERVLSGSFLDFGTSFWGTSLVHKEFPGLETNGYKSTGKFGIGFFSVFMWGDDVTVTTRRFEKSRDSTKVLCFNNEGLERPLLRDSRPDEYIKNGGTRVRVYLNDFESNLDVSSYFSGHQKNKFIDVIRGLCISTDVTIFYDEANKRTKVIEANDWMTLEGDDFIERVIGINKFKKIDVKLLNSMRKLSGNLRNILVNDEVVGRGFILSGYDWNSRYMHRNEFEGVVTVGGFKTTDTYLFFGILLGETSRASRDTCLPIVDQDTFKKWIIQQIDLVSSNLDDYAQLKIQALLRLFGIQNDELKFAECCSGYINPKEFKEILNKDFEEILILQDDTLYMIGKYDDKEIILNDNVFSVNVSYRPVISTINSSTSEGYWPKSNDEWFESDTVEGMVIEETLKYWNVSLSKYIKYISEFDPNETSKSRIIGTMDGKPISANVEVLYKEKLQLL